MYAATALDARVAAMPNCSFIAATPKLIRPVSAAACSAKNRKRATARPESSTRASSMNGIFFASTCLSHERIVAIHAFSPSRNAVTAESVFSG